MSSSRIIKSETLQEQMVAAIDYEAFGLRPGEAMDGGAGTFVPMQVGVPAEHGRHALNHDQADGDAGMLLPGQVPEGMQLLADSDLAQRQDEAFQRGIEEGRRLAERGLANVFRSLREGIDEVLALRHKILRESEDDLLKLSVMVARKIVHQEITIDRQILANIVSAAVSSCGELDRITIRLNPHDYELVAANRKLYLSGLRDDAHVALTADEAITPGGCMVETATGTLDARVEVQLEEIFRRFMEERAMHGGTDDGNEFAGESYVAA